MKPLLELEQCFQSSDSLPPDTVVEQLEKVNKLDTQDKDCTDQVNESHHRNTHIDWSFILLCIANNRSYSSGHYQDSYTAQSFVSLLSLYIQTMHETSEYMNELGTKRFLTPVFKQRRSECQALERPRLKSACCIFWMEWRKIKHRPNF